MRFFRALCATLGALLITSTVVFGAHAADGPTLSEAYVLTKDGQLVDSLTVVDPSRTMSESTCTPYAGSSTDQHVEYVTRDDATVCHMQLMYTRAQDESEFTLQDSGAFVLSARTDRTLAEYRKAFGSSLTLISVSLSVEGEVKSATSGAATSATTYEGRALSVTTWTDAVPQVITVNGSLAAGGNPAAADGANALKDPWGATPIPGDGNSTDSVSPAASDSSSGPSLGLLVALIIGLIVIVLVVVIVIYAIRSKRSTENTPGVGHSAPPSHVRGPSVPQGTQASTPHTPARSTTVPTQSAAIPAMNQGIGATTSPDASQGASPTDSKRPDLSSLPQPKPRDTGFVWQHKSHPAPAAPAPMTPAQPTQSPKRKRSRGGHRPAVFPAQPARPMMQDPTVPSAGHAPGFAQGQGMPPAASAAQASAERYAPAISSTPPPAPAPAPADIPTPARGISAPVAPQAVAHSYEAETQHAVPALERASFDSAASSPVPAPPASMDEAPDTMLIPKVQDAFVPEPPPIPAPEPEPIVVPEPAPAPDAVPEPAPVVVPEPAPVAAPEPEPVAVPEPAPEPIAVPEPAPEPIAVPEPEPEPIAVPEPAPEPVAVPEPEPEPVAVPEPEPEPVAVPEPEPIAVPEPAPAPVAVPEPESASSIPVADEAEMPTAQFPRVRRVDAGAWSTSTRSESGPAPTEPTSAFAPTPPVASPLQGSAPAAPAAQTPSAVPYTPAVPQVAPMQEPPAAMPQAPIAPQTAPSPFTPQVTPQVPPAPQAPAMPQAPVTPQEPEMSASFQEDWNSEFSWNEEPSREQESEPKRRKRWGWGKRRKQREENNQPIEHEVEEHASSARMPMISVDAQDDDWNDWQNWNSRS